MNNQERLLFPNDEYEVKKKLAEINPARVLYGQDKNGVVSVLLFHEGEMFAFTRCQEGYTIVNCDSVADFQMKYEKEFGNSTNLLDGTAYYNLLYNKIINGNKKN